MDQSSAPASRSSPASASVISAHIDNGLSSLTWLCRQVQKGHEVAALRPRPRAAPGFLIHFGFSELRPRNSRPCLSAGLQAIVFTSNGRCLADLESFSCRYRTGALCETTCFPGNSGVLAVRSCLGMRRGFEVNLPGIRGLPSPR